MFESPARSAMVLLGSIATLPGWELVKGWGFENELSFILALSVLMIADFVGGLVRGWALGNIFSRKMGRTILKVLMYGCAFWGTTAFSFYIATISADFAFYIKGGIYSAILLTEFLSLIENIEAVSQLYFKKSVFPKWLVSKLKEFDENGIYKALKKES
jgi:phage-related holin